MEKTVGRGACSVREAEAGGLWAVVDFLPG